MIDYNGGWNFARPFKHVAASIFRDPYHEFSEFYQENGGPSKGRYTDIPR